MYNNSYFSSAPTSNSGCNCKNEKLVEKNCEKPFEPFVERPCFEPRHKEDSIQYQLINGGGNSIATGGAVKFDSIVERIGHGITYNQSTGVFTIKKNGLYEIFWNVSTLTAGTALSVDLTIYKNGAPYATGSSSLVEGEISSSTIICVDDCDTTIYLANTSTSPIVLASTTVQANIVITAD